MSLEATSPVKSVWRSRFFVRIGSGLLILLTAWHIFASFLWIYPPSPLRQLVPDGALSGYMLPFFGQSWSVFAPEPINGDYHFNVRAVVKAKDGEKETGWVSATEVELSMVINHPFPPRAGIQAEELASMQKSAWDQLDESQQSIAASNYYKGNWQARMKSALNVESDKVYLVDEYMARERQATAYATQVAKAIWGDDVLRVQYRVSRQNVVPFIDRNSPNAERPAPQVVETGWRGLLVEKGQNTERFMEVFRSQYERMVSSN
ncbi:DUF5819 family protein [Leucobacter sp. HNU]|uniref:DUF5819 family protein n=1 Tax=Leucobacter sp. HNU TaxID=3236805 RepID=UPI003A80A7AC